VRTDAAKQWSNWLDRIDVKGGTTDQQKIFYTSLYHTAISPNLFTDFDGRYRGMDKKIHQSDSGSENYTVFSLWDTIPGISSADDDHQSIGERSLDPFDDQKV